LHVKVDNENDVKLQTFFNGDTYRVLDGNKIWKAGFAVENSLFERQFLVQEHRERQSGTACVKSNHTEAVRKPIHKRQKNTPVRKYQ
jgi:hypothetical protein